MTTVKRARFMTTDSRKSLPYISDDLVFLILIRLPLESLLRFKTVCKKWRTMIKEEEFVHSHSQYGPIVPFNPEDKHTVVAYCGGIVLEQNHSSKKFRVRNPGFRLVLDLPDPSKTSSIMNFACDGQFKLISFYDDNNGNKGCQLLTFNTDNLSWKTVPAPLEFSNKNRKVFCGLRGDYGVMWYFWTDTRSDESGKKFKIGVESFDVKSERFSSRSFLYPPDVFRDFPKVGAVWWNDWLAVCAIDNDKMKLHTTVLVDLEKQKWHKGKTYDLKFLEEEPEIRDFPLSLVEVTEREYIFRSNEDLKFRVHSNFEAVNWNGRFIEDKRTLRPLPRFSLKHSLIVFKGMQPQTKI